MEITINVVREKIRKKMLYVTTVIGILVVIIFSSGMGSLAIGGRSIDDYYVLVPILINVLNFLAGAIALATSITTVPNEYERCTSHLIWARGISQSRYHFSLAAGNVLASWISGIILYGTLGIFAMGKGYSVILGKIAAASLLMFIYVAIICMVTTVLSIKLPTVVTGVIMIILFVGGAFKGILTLVTAVFTGFGGMMLKKLLVIVPDLAGISKQAGNLVQGHPVNLRPIVMGLLFIWLAGFGFLHFKKNEA